MESHWGSLRKECSKEVSIHHKTQLVLSSLRKESYKKIVLGNNFKKHHIEEQYHTYEPDPFVKHTVELIRFKKNIYDLLKKRKKEIMSERKLEEKISLLPFPTLKTFNGHETNPSIDNANLMPRSRPVTLISHADTRKLLHHSVALLVAHAGFDGAFKECNKIITIMAEDYILEICRLFRESSQNAGFSMDSLVEALYQMGVDRRDIVKYYNENVLNRRSEELKECQTLLREINEKTIDIQLPCEDNSEDDGEDTDMDIRDENEWEIMERKECAKITEQKKCTKTVERQECTKIVERQEVESTERSDDLADAIQADVIQADVIQANVIQADAIQADVIQADAIQAGFIPEPTTNLIAEEQSSSMVLDSSSDMAGSDTNLTHTGKVGRPKLKRRKKKR